MCVNIKRITNKYTGASLYVPCGKCEACQQEKAARRASRIRNNNALGQIALFITLTYDRLSCPVVFREDLHNRADTLNIYRLCDFRRVRHGKDYTMAFKRVYKLTKLGEFHDCVYPDSMQDKELPSLAKLNSKYVGVCYYKDVQDFFKRLNSYINYHYGFTDFKYSYFCTSEYGETTYRPHHHALLFIPAKYEAAARSAVAACWPFGDRRRLGQYTQVARDAASYVASYVNSDTDFPEIYKTRTFKPKHSMSKGFGCNLECFSLASILQKATSRDCTYNAVSHKDGIAMVSRCAIPKYVINRFFPLYKGYSFRSDIENRQFITCPSRFAKVPPRALYERIIAQSDTKQLLRYNGKTLDKYYHKYCFRNVLSPDEFRKIDVSLNNAFDYYHKVTGRSRYDYAIDFVRVWNAYKSTCLRLFYDKASENNYIDAYDNIGDYLSGAVRSINLDEYGLQVTSVDPNQMTLNLQKHMRLLTTYQLKKKTRKVTNHVMSHKGHYV